MYYLTIRLNGSGNSSSSGKMKCASSMDGLPFKSVGAIVVCSSDRGAAEISLFVQLTMSASLPLGYGSRDEDDE
uniref:Uncharacterized protein n=1 Tax=Romanomermis culicivorax TaxID=13658 RepID=A0A915KUE7_ROMCU